jgi:hypothetical protein
MERACAAKLSGRVSRTAGSIVVVVIVVVDSVSWG